MPTPDRGWEHFDVEADVGVRAWGPSRAVALAEAALGVLALIVDPDSVDARESREVRAQADTPETLLAAWIDECLYVHEIEGFAARGVEVTGCGDSVVHGRLLGEPLDPRRHRLGTVVKAATLHGLVVTGGDGRHEVRIVVDV
jgi:SHS2 domain-containing protein